MRFTDLSAFTTEQGEETCRRIGVSADRRVAGRRVVLFLSKNKTAQHRSTKRRHADTPTRRSVPPTPTRRYVSPHG